MIAWCYAQNQANGWVDNRAQEIAETVRVARRAVELGKDDAVALARAGHALAYVVHDFDAGTFFVDRALVLNPNLAFVWYSSGWIRVWLGEPDEAIKHFAKFKRMSSARSTHTTNA